MIDSRDVTWASIPPLASLLCEHGGQEPTELQNMESVERETNACNGESDELQSDRQKSAGDGEDHNDDESIFPLDVDPAPTQAATPVGRVTQAMPLDTTADAPLSIGGPAKAYSERSPLAPAPYRPHLGRTPMVPCLCLCWAGGKRAGSNRQRPVQLARSKDARVEIFADYTRPQHWSSCRSGWSGTCA